MDQQEAQALVARFGGNKRAAARSVGMPVSTLTDRINGKREGTARTHHGEPPCRNPQASTRTGDVVTAASLRQRKDVGGLIRSYLEARSRGPDGRSLPIAQVSPVEQGRMKTDLATGSADFEKAIRHPSLAPFRTVVDNCCWWAIPSVVEFIETPEEA